MARMPSYSLTVNGNAYSVEAKPDLPLVWALRDLLGRGVVRIGCGRGAAGTAAPAPSG